MSDFTDEQFEYMRSKAEKYYGLIAEVYCPYFQEKVSFNSKGKEHLKFKNKNHTRPKSDQYTRFRILSLAPKVIGLSRTIQGIAHTKNFELMRSGGRTDIVLKPVSYYEFIAILEDKRVRVVVNQIEDGPKYFWSILPFWKTDKHKVQRKMNSGNLEDE